MALTVLLTLRNGMLDHLSAQALFDFLLLPLTGLNGADETTLSHRVFICISGHVY